MDAPVALQATDWGFVAENLDYLLGGTVVTVVLTLASVLVGFLVGFPAGAVEVYGSGYGKRAVELVGIVLRGTPIVVIMVYFFFVLRLSDSAFGTATLALGLRSAAYQSQIFRGALRSVGGGQMEAARAVGLTRFSAIRFVVVPQALRRSVPPLGGCKRKNGPAGSALRDVDAVAALVGALDDGEVDLEHAVVVARRDRLDVEFAGYRDLLGQ